MKKLTVLLILAALLVVLGGCELLGQKEILYQVTYSEIGGLVDIRYENEEGDLEEAYNVTPPWSHSFTVNRTAAAIVVYVAAEIKDFAGGTVTVTIREDGYYVTGASTSGYGQVAEAAAVIE